MSCSSIKNYLFERYNEDYNVLSENENRVIITFDDTDLSVLVNKKENKLFVLVPLTKMHSFEYYPDWILVDGERINSTLFWKECGCQVIEYQGDAPIIIKQEAISRIINNFFKNR
jgi:hypothetical protein|nr:MAG TPA_asm: RNA binding protein [Caudoviricetes sp.]